MFFLLWVYGEESWRPKAGTSADIPEEKKNYRPLTPASASLDVGQSGAVTQNI